jgi:DNA-binding transcriptional LysR family regulator
MLDALSLDQLRILVAVAEAGSFRGAAKRVLRAQSAVSHAIRSLEAQLDLELFDRNAYRPTLSAAGRVLLEDARATLLQADLLRARARSIRAGVEVELALTSDPLFPVGRLAEALKVVQGTYPTLSVRLSSGSLGAPIAALRDGRATLAIVVGDDFRDRQFTFEAIGEISMFAVAALDHPLARLAGKEPGLSGPDLAAHRQVVVSDPTSFSEGRDFGVVSPITWRVGTHEAKHALILSGLGWGRLPDWMIERDLAERRLVRLPATPLGLDGATRLPAYLVRRTDAPPGLAGRVLRASLLEQLTCPTSSNSSKAESKPRKGQRAGLRKLLTIARS